MKQNILLVILLISAVTYAKEPIKVACIGNSITYGHGLKNRDSESYPAVLAKMLGAEYEVRNYGVSARTMLNKGDHPYMCEKQFAEARAFAPDIVVIKLGTNDSKPHNWKYRDEFDDDMKAMIDSLRVGANPTIYLCYPATVYGEQWGINDTTIVSEIIPIIKKVARKKRTKVIDLHTPTAGMPQNFPDRVHPNATAAEILATEVYKAIRKNSR